MYPVLQAALSPKGLQKQIRGFIAAELGGYKHMDDSAWVRRKLRTSGVHVAGFDKTLLAYWYADVDRQMKAVWAAPTPSPVPRAVAKVQPLLQRAGQQINLFDRPRLSLAP